MRTELFAIFTAFVALTIPDEAQSQDACTYRRGGVRLQGGRNSSEGRLEICNNGQWGRVCDTGFDSRDATVVCRQIGALTNSVTSDNFVQAVAVNGSHYGRGQGPVWLNNLNCSGSESSLVSCLTSEEQRSAWLSLPCTSFASVLCLETDRGQSVRLVGGRNEREGSVEVYYGGDWGPVCATETWGEREARTVCRELGLLENGAVGYKISQQQVIDGLVSDVQCMGSETRLVLCHEGIWQRQSCSQGQAAVICLQFDAGGCQEGSLRLAGRNSTRQGRLESCHSGVWGSVCHNGGLQWTNTDADLICRQLGFQDQDEIGARAVSPGQFGQGVGVIWSFRAADCGREGQSPCTPSDWVGTNCSNSTTAAIICPEPKQRLYLCVNIRAQSIYKYDTLYNFYNSAATMIASTIQSNCLQPCSYSSRDVSFQSSWPSPIHPTAMCLPRESVLGVRVACRYRPKLNQNGLFQYRVSNALWSLGATISCSSYSAYITTKDFVLSCENRSVSIQPQPTTIRHTPTIAVTPSKLSSMIRFSSTKAPVMVQSVSMIRGFITLNSKPLSTSTRIIQLLSSVTEPKSSHNLPTSTGGVQAPSATPAVLNGSKSHALNPSLAPGSKVSFETLGSQPLASPPLPAGDFIDPQHLTTSMPQTTRVLSSIPEMSNKKEGSDFNLLMTVLMVLLVFSAVLLLLCLFSVIYLFTERRKRKKQSKFTQNNLTTSAVNPIQIHSNIPSPSITDTSTGYYEEVDSHSHHHYAILEPPPLPADQRSPRSITALSPSTTIESGSTHHEYFVLEHSNRNESTAVTPQHSVKSERGCDIPDEESLYSTLVHIPPNYAIPDPKIQSVKPGPDQTEYSSLDTGDMHLKHDYQAVLPEPDGDYDKTFASGFPGPPSLK